MASEGVSGDRSVTGRIARTFAPGVAVLAGAEIVVRFEGGSILPLGGAGEGVTTAACLLLLAVAVAVSGAGRKDAARTVALAALTAGAVAALPGVSFLPVSTGLLVVLLGLAVALADVETPSRRRAVEILVFASLSVGLYAAFRSLRGLGGGAAGAVGPVLFAALAASLLVDAPSAVGALLRRDTPGGWLARRLLPAAILVPVALGLAGVGVERAGLIALVGGTDVVVVLAVALAAAIALRSAGALDRHEDAARAGRELRREKQAADQADEDARDRMCLAAEVAVGRALADAASLPAATPRLLEAIGSALGWSAASAWSLDREGNVLRCAGIWKAPGVVLDGLEEAMRDTPISRGVDLPGRVWAEGRPAWVSDVAADPGFGRPALAAQAGLRSACAFPIRRGEELLGLIELLGREVRPPDDELLERLVDLARRIARFVEQRRGEERLREEVRTLEAVNREVSILSSETDLDERIRLLTDAATKLIGARSGTFYRLRADAEDPGFVAYNAAAAGRDTFGLPRPARLLMPSFSSDGPVRIQDLRRELRSGEAVPSFGSNGSSPAVASYLAVPVVSRSGRTVGGLAFSHPEPAVFAEREERIATGLAAQIAAALDNAALLEAERRARREAETANRTKEEFLAMLGHELRNPIGAIRNSVQALESSQETTEAGRLLCTIIGRQTENLGHLVDDLLDVSRLMSGKIRLRRRVVDLKEIAEQTLQSFRAAGKVARHFVQLSAETVFVDADPVRLEQIVTNLLENAIKYTQAGGEIAVVVERVGEIAQLRVRDNGQGIDPDLLPRMFEVFTQGEQSLDRAKGGMGLGLALVRRLAELHGGTVEAESPGRGLGSEFRVRLPARPQIEQRALELPAARTARIGPPRRVLIVEDHGDSRESLRLLLEVTGHRAEVADNGFDGLEMALTNRPEIAIIDIGIPGMDGYQVAREIRAADGGHHIYLVALTGYGQSIDRRRALEAGFNEHMVKPVERERLLRLLASVERPVEESRP